MAKDRLDSKSVEEIGVYAVKSYFLHSKTISPDIATNDKKPVWDGMLELYDFGYKNMAEHLIGTIPVQVKAKSNTNIPEQSVKLNVKINNIKTYLNNRGIAYFLVYVHPDSLKAKIFYSLLAPVDLNKYLCQAGNANSVSIDLRILPDCDEQLELQFLDFFNDCKRQGNFKAPIYLRDVKKEIATYNVQFAISSSSGVETLKYLTSHEFFVYVTFKNDPTKTLHPLGDSRCKLKATSQIDINISVSGKTYFENCDVELENGELCYIIGNVVKFYRPKNPQNPSEKKITISPFFKTLSQKIKVLEFLNAIAKETKFSFGDEEITVSGFKAEILSGIEKDLTTSKQIEQVFSILNVHEDLDVSNLSQSDLNNINVLIHYFLFKDSITPNNDIGSQFTKIDIANISLLFLIEKNTETGKYTLYGPNDFCKLDFVLDTNDETYIHVPPYVAYSREVFRDVYDIDYEKLFLAFKLNAVNNLCYYECVSMTVLRMILGYDEQKRKNPALLQTALELTDWLEQSDSNKDNHDFYVINHLQIIRRMRDLNDNEENILYEYIEKAGNDIELKFSAYVLLGQNKLAIRYFNQLDPQTKDIYKKEYPIYNLLNNEI